jgi:hypothetical protein
MWLVTSIGFFSVVAHDHDRHTVLVRARTREDLEALRRRYLPDLEILENAGTDYRFRALLERSEWEYAAERLAADIDYPNFKDAVHERQGAERAQLYARIWSTLRELQA